MRGNIVVLSVLIATCFAAVDVSVWGNFENFRGLADDLAKHGANLSHFDTGRQAPLHELGEWTADGLILLSNDFDETQVIDFINAGKSLVVFVEEGNDNQLGLLEEIGILPSKESEKIGQCTYTSPMQDKTTSDISCGGYSFTESPSNKTHYYKSLT
ncbi:MAG: hypothetical protein EZS28_054314, partial [Streblomastix strix]